MSKKNLVLIPGTLCDERIWAHQVDGLNDFANISIADISSVGSIEAISAKILANSPKTFALAGFSFGGIIAFEIMRQAPERVTHLILISTNARSDNEATKAAKLEQLAAAERLGLEEMVETVLLPKYFAAQNNDNNELKKTVISMASDLGLVVFKDQVLSVMRRVDSRKDLKYIKCPTLIIYGEEDVVCPEDRHIEIADNIKHSVLRSLSNCGHMSLLESGKQITEDIRRFLME